MPKSPTKAVKGFTASADNITLTKAAELAYALGGNDTVDAGAGGDTVYGGLGDDQLGGQDGDDVLYGEFGQDFLGGGAGNDLIYGGEELDIILGEAGDDVLYGDAGNDILEGNIGNNTLQGGVGTDALTYTWLGTSQPLYVNLALGYAVDQTGLNGAPPPPGSGQTFNDTFTGIEDVTGAPFAPNWLIGDLNANKLYGGYYADTIEGGKGIDLLMGRSGADVFVVRPGDAPGGGGMIPPPSEWYIKYEYLADFVSGEDKLMVYGLPNSIGLAYVEGRTLISFTFEGPGGDITDTYAFSGLATMLDVFFVT